MEIINKSKNLFQRKFENYFNRNDFYSYIAECKAITFCIFTELKGDNRTKYLQASVQWCYSTSTTIKQDFEYSVEGFDKACTWIDEMRIEFIKQLL